MQLTFWLIVFPGLIWTLLYFRSGLLLSTIITAIALANWSYFLSHSIFAIALVWIAFFACKKTKAKFITSP